MNRKIEVQVHLKSSRSHDFVSVVTDDRLSIGEVAARSGIATSALRFYESQGLVHAVRNEGGQRRYERDVLRRVAFIRVAQRVGLALEEIRSALTTLPDERTPTAKDWARLSRTWRPRLDEQIAVLTSLRDQLSSCIGCGCLSLRACALYNPDDAASALGTGPRYLLGDSSADVLEGHD
jgi:MerR family redox-sensitive transcriptional activator SoxR